MLSPSSGVETGSTILAAGAAAGIVIPPAGGERFGEITHYLALFAEKFFDRMIDSQFARETGCPMLTTYRVNRSVPGTGVFSVDIKAVFRWTSQPGKRITIRLLNEFTPPPVDHLEPFSSPVAPPLTQTQALRQRMPFFFRPEPDFAALFNRINLSQGLYNQDIAEAALKLPHTALQRIALVEVMIDFYEYVRRSDWEDLSGRRTPCALAELENKAKKASHFWLKKLPRDYQDIAPKASALKVTYQSVLELIQAGRVDEAWALFEPVSQVSSFIRYAFPHLQAMGYELTLLFVISGHKLDDGEYCDITESSIFRYSQDFLNRACTILEPYNARQKEQLETLALAPIRELVEAGKAAASRTSQAERERIRHERSYMPGSPFPGWRDAPYRDPLDDIDADDGPSIVEISDDESTPRSSSSPKGV